MQNIKKKIASVALFAGLSDAQKDQILSIAELIQVRRHEIIFSEGDPCNGFYVVLEGFVKIYKLSPDGKEKILHLFGKNEPFGEVPVFSGHHFPAIAQAMQDSRLLFFPRKDFIQIITDNPSLSLNMLAMLSFRLRQFADQIEALALKEVPGRLATYFLDQTREQNSDNRMVLSITKGQLAALIGTIPETLSRVLARLSDQGLIRVDGKNIVIRDMEQLKKIAGMETL